MTPERELALHQRLVALEREKQDFRIGRARAREGLVEFVKQMVPDIRPAKFHLLMAEKLEAVERGEIPRLLLALPPGHGRGTGVDVGYGDIVGRCPGRDNCRDRVDRCGSGFLGFGDGVIHCVGHSLSSLFWFQVPFQ